MKKKMVVNRPKMTNVKTGTTKKAVDSQKSATDKLYGVTLYKNTQIKKFSKEALVMQPCTAQFALAIADPFNPAARGVCVPSEGGMTQKLMAQIVTDIVIGTGGSAVIYVTPCLANDQPTLVLTGATYAGSNSTSTAALSAANTLTTGFSAVSHNGLYTTTQFIQGGGLKTLQGRIVAAGLRVQYTGKTTNEGGVYYCRHDGAHIPVTGSLNSDIGPAADSDVKGINREPCQLIIHPVTDQELTWSALDADTSANIGTNTLYPFCGNALNWSTTYNGTTGYQYQVLSYAVGAPVGVLLITGTAGETIHIDYVQHMEFSGTLVAAEATKSESDIEGAKKVIAAAKLIPAMKKDMPTSKFEPWKLMYGALTDVWSGVKPIVVRASVSAVAAALL